MYIIFEIANALKYQDDSFTYQYVDVRGQGREELRPFDCIYVKSIKTVKVSSFLKRRCISNVLNYLLN